MRYRLMATYQGAPYEAGVGPSDGDVVLFAACPPPEELGFEPATGHWRKQLRVQDVQALWESRPMATYRGQRCMVLDDLGDRLHIAYLGHDAFEAQQLGYWQVDRGVFELVTLRDEVTDLTEERADYPGYPAGNAAKPRDAMGYGPANAGHRPATADYGPAAADYGPATADYGPLSGDYGPATMDFGVLFPAGGLTAAPVSPDFGATSLPVRSPAAPAPDFGITAPGRSPAPPAPDFGTTAPVRSPAPPWSDFTSDFTVAPPAREAPMPLEAAALRAASAAAHAGQARLTAQAPLAPLTTQEFLAAQAPPVAAQVPAVTDTPLATTPLATQLSPAVTLRSAALDLLAAPAGTAVSGEPARPPAPQAPVTPDAAVTPATTESPRRRRSARSRMATQGIFTELAALAAIPSAAYAVGEEVDGALCLIETASGYEVFSAAGGARHEVRFFEDEESAYFYLFGVLAAEAVRTGLLIPHR